MWASYQILLFLGKLGGHEGVKVQGDLEAICIFRAMKKIISARHGNMCL